MHRLLVGIGVLSLAACEPELAECTGSEAEIVVFLGSDGTAMFEGQALLYLSCSNGTCHDSSISERDRNGAPAGLDFNVQPACVGSADECRGFEGEALERLQRAARHVSRFDTDIVRTLQDDSMPPAGQAPPEIQAFRNFTDGVLSDPVPPITTPEGRRAVSRWLGCGAPILDTSLDTENPERDIPSFRCDDVAGTVCAYGAPRQPPDPQWGGETGIFRRVIVQQGCLSCHRDNNNSNWGPDDQELDLCLSSPDPAEGDCDPDAVLASLVGQAAVGYDCAGTDPGQHIVANSPATSFFLSKLEDAPLCGDPMPQGSDSGLPADFLTPIREWIMAGAMP